MSNEVEFYTNLQSRGAIVKWMLEEVGCEYETHALDYATSMKSETYLAINPMGKVPAIPRYKKGSICRSQRLSFRDYFSRVTGFTC